MNVNLGYLNHFFIKFGDNRTTLAEKLGMTRQNLSQIISGKQSITIETVRKIAEIYVMTPEEVYRTLIFPEESAPNTGWILCSERLPEPLEPSPVERMWGTLIYTTRSVLVTVECTRITGETTYYVATDVMTGKSKDDMKWIGSCFYGGGAVAHQEIIAWRPLPTPYNPTMKGEDEHGKIHEVQ